MDKECFLCKSKEKDEVKFGEFMTRGKISVHYFCLLLSSNLMQNGQDHEGLLGFLPKDIQEEAQRVKPLICCYCQKPSANISCCASRCYKSFHLTCGDQHSTEHNFVGTFKSFCHRHVKGKKVTPPLPDEKCCICYDNILATGKRFDTVNMIRAPCCKNGWFHKYCLASFAKTAGYFFKCPLCNDSKVFRQRLAYKSIFIPDRDAAWELEPNAFSELLERPNTCVAVSCCAENGRKSQTKRNKFLFCSTCGSVAIHRLCMTVPLKDFYCDECASITAAIENSSVVNITPTKLNNYDSEDEENEEIDVGDNLDVSYENNTETQIYSGEEYSDELIKPIGIAKKKYALPETTDVDLNNKDEYSESDNTSIKPLEIFKNNTYRLTDDDSLFNDSDDEISTNRNPDKHNKPIFSNELLDKQSTSATCKGHKRSIFNRTESLFDSGEESDHSGSSAYKCNISSSFDTTTIQNWEKSELRVLVHVKKLNSLEIESRVNRRFISLSDDNNDKNDSTIVRPKRSLSEYMETFSNLSGKEKDCTYNNGNLKTEIVHKEDRNLRSIISFHDSSLNKTNHFSSTKNSVASKMVNEPLLVTKIAKKSPIRLRSLSEDTSKRCSRRVERRKSLIQGSSSSTSIERVTEVNSIKRPSESLESTSIKRSRLDSMTDKESCALNQEHINNINSIYEDENKIDRLQATNLKRRRSRGRSPLSVNLCDVYAYSTLPYVKKVSAQNVDKTVLSGNYIDMQPNLSEAGQIFPKNKSNIPQPKSLQQSKLKVKDNATQDINTNQTIAATDATCNIFEIFVASDKLKQQKNKIKRIPLQKSTKRISISPSNQTKIESFFKRI